MPIHNAIMNIHNSIRDDYNCIMGTHTYTLKLLHYQLSPSMQLWISMIELLTSIIDQSHRYDGCP